MIPWHEPWTVLGTLLMEDEEVGAVIHALEWDRGFEIIQVIET
jgi:hypothetical protein